MGEGAYIYSLGDFSAVKYASLWESRIRRRWVDVHVKKVLSHEGICTGFVHTTMLNDLADVCGITLLLSKGV